MHATTINMYISNLKDRILENANSDQHYLQAKETLQQDNFQHKFKYYDLKEGGVLMHKGKLYVAKYQELKNIVLRDMHNVPYSRNP
jgi:hypothetical protein